MSNSKFWGAVHLRRYELRHDEQGEWEMCPSASLVYQFELEFLRELCDLTRIAMCGEMGEVNCFGDGEAGDGEDEDTDDEAAAESLSQERIDGLENIRHFKGC